jgi:hypothetical protein
MPDVQNSVVADAAMDGGKGPSPRAKKNQRTRQKQKVFSGEINKTSSGQKQTDLTKNKSGRVVSKAKHDAGKQNLWVQATMKAREALKKKGTIQPGFVPVGGKTPGGQALLTEARRLYAAMKSK